MRSMITATFESEGAARRAVDALIERHCSSKDVGVLWPGAEAPDRPGLFAGLRDGCLVGLAVGAIAGAAGVMLLGQGWIQGPALDPVAAMPTQLAAVQGFLWGGAGGALIGLAGWREEVPAAATTGGGPFVVGVLARGHRIAELRRVLEALGGTAVHVSEPGDEPRLRRIIRAS